MSNNEFDREYRKWLQQLDVSGADSMWEAIEDQLDLTESWDKIHEKLDIIQPQRKYILFTHKTLEIAATIAILLLIPFMIYLIKENNKTSLHTDQIVSEAVTPESIPDNAEIYNHIEKMENNLQEKKSDSSVAGTDLHVEKETVYREEISHSFTETIISPVEKLSSNAEKELHPVELLSPEETLFSSALTPDSVTGIPYSDDIVISSEETILPSEKMAVFPYKIDPSFTEKLINKEEKTRTEKSDKFAQAPEITGIKYQFPELSIIIEKEHDVIPEFIASAYVSTSIAKKSSAAFLRFQNIGLVYSYKNTWLLNYETRNGLNPAKLGNTLPTFRHDMGITSTLTIKNKYNIGLEFLWMSEAGQNYQQYINASYVNRNITLNYFKLQSWYMWNYRKIPGNLITGGYFARLGMAEEIQGDVKFNVKNDYRNNDYGFVLGYQLNVPLFNNIVICPGVRFNFNLINIFEGHAGTINIFKTTNNFTTGINIAFTYNF